jgi:hypothetical protein
VFDVARNSHAITYADTTFEFIKLNVDDVIGRNTQIDNIKAVVEFSDALCN